MPRIENEVAVVEVKTLAAEITSFYDKEKNIEHMWQGDPQFWAGRNPILFPLSLIHIFFPRTGAISHLRSAEGSAGTCQRQGAGYDG